MKTKMIYLLLAISLGFNLFFVTGYWTTKKRLSHESPLQRRVEIVAKQLSLSKEQKRVLTELLKESGRRLQELKIEQRATVRLFRAEFKKENPDIEKLRTAMENIESRYRKTREELGAKWRAFFASLDEKQRKKAMRLLKHKPDLRKRWMIPSAEQNDAIR